MSERYFVISTQAIYQKPSLSRRKVKILLAIAVALFWMLVAFLALPAQAEVLRYPITGNSDDVNPPLAGPVYDLGGGGPDVDAAIQWMIDQVRGCTDCSTKVDVLVIRSSGGPGYNDAIYNMNGVDSVETLVIQSREDANRADIADSVKEAEVIFFAGGDQCQYTRNFKRTGVEAAVESVSARGGGIGGTSAGAMIQSNFVYNACSDTVETPEALEDPYEDILFTYDLFKWPNLNGTIVDTHFYQRDRMGRAMTFIARQIRDGISDSALAIAVDEGTSVVVDQNGLARVMGNDQAYFVLGDHLPEVCEPQTPLTFSDYKIWALRSGDTFDLYNRPTTGYYLSSVYDGEISSNPY
ncbi:MAG: cyanophycinase [Xenococcaceae cyanobacterium]